MEDNIDKQYDPKDLREADIVLPETGDYRGVRLWVEEGLCMIEDMGYARDVRNYKLNMNRKFLDISEALEALSRAHPMGEELIKKYFDNRIAESILLNGDEDEETRS